jgi:hypothetical protein
VFGGEDEAQWTNIDGVHRQRFLNPLIQNEGRTRALQKVVPDVPVENLVIFTGSVWSQQDRRLGRCLAYR